MVVLENTLFYESNVTLNKYRTMFLIYNKPRNNEAIFIRNTGRELQVAVIWMSYTRNVLPTCLRRLTSWKMWRVTYTRQWQGRPAMCESTLHRAWLGANIEVPLNPTACMLVRVYWFMRPTLPLLSSLCMLIIRVEGTKSCQGY